MKKLKDKAYAAQYLTKALNGGDPINLQCALLDVIKAQGGYHKVAAATGISEWQLKLMLWDGECWKLLRLVRLLNGMGLWLNVNSKRQKNVPKS